MPSQIYPAARSKHGPLVVLSACPCPKNWPRARGYVYGIPVPQPETPCRKHAALRGPLVWLVLEVHPKEKHMSCFVFVLLSFLSCFFVLGGGEGARLLFLAFVGGRVQPLKETDPQNPAEARPVSGGSQAPTGKGHELATRKRKQP